MNVSEGVGFAGLIVTIITSIFLPFIQRPAINYDVHDGTATNTYTIDILNYGPITAHNVIISLKSAGGNVTLFSSEPYLSTAYLIDNSTGSRDTAFAKLGVLPPFASVRINAAVDGPLQPAASLHYVYVSSDEAIGRVTQITFLMILGAAVFIVTASLASYGLWSKFIKPRGPVSTT
jgi:hypothetical protein